MISRKSKLFCTLLDDKVVQQNHESFRIGFQLAQGLAEKPIPRSMNDVLSSQECMNVANGVQLTTVNVGAELVLARNNSSTFALKEQESSDISKNDSERVELTVIALLLDAIKRTSLSCQNPPEDIKVDIGWPTNVQHVTHVTFDRFDGFLGLPVEFQNEIVGSVPSASASVFGVSPESMQCSYDRKGSSVPIILMHLQQRLYDQGGLKAEGIFRLNAENSQEERVREQLNRGIVPYDIEVHCLAGLIKAWFRELPKGVLDSLLPEQVLECQTEEQSLALVKTLPATQAALLNWVIDLMADVVELEHLNKMNARNIAMVFAPNMTQMADPLIALMHAVEVMNFLKTLVLRCLREREEGCSSYALGSCTLKKQ